MNRRSMLPAGVHEAVEHALSARYGARVCISGVTALQVNSVVSRCVIEASVRDVPESVIVRQLHYDARRPGSGLAALHNERAALEFLPGLGSELAPRVIAADDAVGVLVTEDLGAGPLVLDLLLGKDPGAARRGLVAFAHGLGTLHAQNVGRAEEYGARRASLGSERVERAGAMTIGYVGASWRRVRDAVTQLGLPAPRDPRAVDADVEESERGLTGADDHLALSSGDVGPLNCKIAVGPDGRAVARFFDFELGGFRHALLDATVLRYPYPTGGPVWRVPPEVTAVCERAYRDAVAAAVPDVLDDATYERGMAAACAAWTLRRLERLPRVEAGPDRDGWSIVPPDWPGPHPTRSRRRQLVEIVETFVASARGAGALEGLAEWGEDLIEALRGRWPEASEPLVLYRAFGG